MIGGLCVSQSNQKWKSLRKTYERQRDSKRKKSFFSPHSTHGNPSSKFVECFSRFVKRSNSEKKVDSFSSFFKSTPCTFKQSLRNVGIICNSCQGKETAEKNNLIKIILKDLSFFYIGPGFDMGGPVFRFCHLGDFVPVTGAKQNIIGDDRRIFWRESSCSMGLRDLLLWWSY